MIGADTSTRLDRPFFDRPAPDVARDLLGCLLIRSVAGEGGAIRVSVRIVETEAYTPDDPASHSFGGRTARNASMFDRPGTLYVYLVYGVHHCMNAVTGPVGEGSAVLIRAGEPLEGKPIMRRRRRVSDDSLLCRGPGRLAQAVGVDRTDDAVDLCGEGGLWIERGITPAAVAESRRVGVRAGIETPWRFTIADDPWTSRSG